MKISKEHYFLLQSVKKWFDHEEQVSHYTNELANAPLAAERYLLGELPSRGSVLDAGCGAGRISTELAERGFHVTGIDVSGELLSVARENTRKSGLDIRYIQLEGVTLPFLNEQFDAIILFKLLGYIPTKPLRKAYLRELYRVLKPGGVCVMTQNIVPNEYVDDAVDDDYRSSPAARFSILEKGDTFPLGTGYVHWFTENGLLDELQDSAFMIEEFRSDDELDGAGFLRLIRLRKPNH